MGQAEAFASLHEALRDAIAHGLGWSSLRPVQALALEAIRSGDNAVILAPTAGGKTEAALIPVLDATLKGRCAPLSALYLCPLRALLNNLEGRVRNLYGLVGLQAFKWHGDVEDRKKRRFLRDPADLLMTTPESVEAMLVSARTDAAALFGNLRVVIVDEVHAFAGDDRGAHLLSILERLQALAGPSFQRIALSATIGNPEHLASWLRGSSAREVQVVRPPAPPSPKMLRVVAVGDEEDGFAAVAASEAQGKKALLFVDSRREAEAAGTALRTKLATVFVHHSSVSRDVRAEAERAFAEADTAAIVATSTLELGIDVGDLDVVQQRGAPRTVSSFLQRLGRTGRRSGTARMTFYVADGAELVQAIALIELAKRRWVESIEPTARSWHVLVHQIITGVLAQPGILADDLWSVIRRAFPFHGFTGEEYLRLVRHLVAQDILYSTGAGLALGREGEKRFARRNYFDLFAVFEGAREMAVKTEGGDDVGTLQTSYVLTEKPENFVFVLAGRTWQATEINPEAGVIWARPAPGGKVPRWQSRTPDHLGYQVTQEHRRVLASEEMYAYLSPAAQVEIRQARAEWAEVTAEDGWCIRESERGTVVFTFSGGRINTTIAKALAVRIGSEVGAGNYELLLRSEAATPGRVGEELQRLRRDGVDPELQGAVVASLPRRRLSKFQGLLPREMEDEFLVQRLLDFEGAAGALRASSIVVLP